jgi:hypothetical protein
MRISFVGDISLHGLDASKINIEKNVSSILNDSDLTVGNLETPVTSSEKMTELLAINLKAGVSSINLLKHFDVLSLCNNHNFDYGLEGFQDTVNFLNDYGIKHFGGGLNLAEAKSSLKVSTGNIKIAFLGGTRWSNAKRDSFGTSGYDGHKKTIKELKKEKYFVVYYPHWGYEYIKTPPPDVRKHAKEMIDCGVDVIVGTHPHILQGYEKYKGKYIFYSLGNFIFANEIIDKMAPKKNHNDCFKSVILQISVKENGSYDCNLYPIGFTDEGIKMQNDAEKLQTLGEIEKISKIFYSNYRNYLKSYYKQIPELVRLNIEVRNNLQNFKEQSFVNKLFILKTITKQDLLNRIAFLILKK